MPLDQDIARVAAQQANQLFGKWVPEQWLNLFIDSYDDIEACRAVPVEPEAPSSPEVGPHMREHGWWESYKG